MLLFVLHLLAVYFATVVAAERGSPRDIAPGINAKQAALVATSVTVWLGRGLAADCENAALLPYDRAGCTAHG